MNTIISNELELYSIKGNVNAGKIMLFRVLESRFGSDKDKIKELVVNEYQIMKSKHFSNSWNDYMKTKRFINLDSE
tara:strand:- start:1095 stop:1322 length:228 start_codon:yes stop_codon:yes gene_type:complete